jgi:hypothetical protein
MNKDKAQRLQERGWEFGNADDFLNSKRKRIKLHYSKEMWGFYPDGDFLVLKRVPKRNMRPYPTDIKASIDEVYCTYVTFHYQNKKLMSKDWTEVLPSIVSLGITADIASRGVEYLKSGGKKLVLNIYANSIALGEQVIHGPIIGFPASQEEKALLKKELKDLRPVKMKKESPNPALCPTCHGSGYMFEAVPGGWDRVKCDDCNGSGKRPTRDDKK